MEKIFTGKKQRKQRKQALVKNFGDWLGIEEEDLDGKVTEQEAEEVRKQRACAMSTARVYASHHRKWSNFCELKKVTYPFRPIQKYREFMIHLLEDCELQGNSAKAVTFEMMRHHHITMEDPWDVGTKSLDYELQLTRQVINNVINNNEKETSKARPVTIEQFRALPEDVRKIMILWMNTGARLETLSHLYYEDMTRIGKKEVLIKWRSLVLGSS